MISRIFSRNPAVAWDFAFILFLFVLVSIPILAPPFMFFPAHDTQFAFQIFANFFYELFVHNQIPMWRPYDSYGMSADLYKLFSISSAQYFALYLGKLLRIEAVLALFKISMILDQIPLVMGSYLLAKALF